MTEDSASAVADPSADRFVEGAGARIATRDHRGAGRPVLLIHGAGRTLADFEGMVPLLAAHHRVVAMDLRGHGRSEEGGWNWDDVVADVRAVVAAYELERPAIVGHSLGGIIGALYGEHQDCSAVINIDGHLQDRPDLYAGMEPAEAAQRIAELKVLSQAIWDNMQAPLTEEAVNQARTAALAQAEAAVVDPSLALDCFERALERRPDGTYRRRPSKATIDPMLFAVTGFDLFALYRRVGCPLLIYNCVAAEAAVPGAPEWLGPLMTAFRRGLRRELSTLAAERPNVSVLEVEAGHLLILDRAELVANQVLDYLAAN